MPRPNFYDEIELEDMSYDDERDLFHYPCPCGDRFEITRQQLRDAEDVAKCPSCSLIIRVVFDPLDFEDEDDNDGAQVASDSIMGAVPTQPEPICDLDLQRMVRFKNRWLLVHVDYEQDDTGTSVATSAAKNVSGAGSGTPMALVLLRTIRDLVQLHFGDAGAGAIGGSLAVRYYSSQTGNAIVRCARLGMQHVWAALTLCTHLDHRRVRLLVTHCGGTIRKVQQAAIRQDARYLTRLYMERTRRRQDAVAVAAAAAEPERKSAGNIDEASQAIGSAVTLDPESAAVLETNKRAILAIQS